MFNFYRDCIRSISHIVDISKLSSRHLDRLVLEIENELKGISLKKYERIIDSHRMQEILVKCRVLRKEFSFLKIFAIRKFMLKIHPSLDRMSYPEVLFLSEHPKAVISHKIANDYSYAKYSISPRIKDSLWNSSPTHHDLIMYIKIFARRAPTKVVDFFQRFELSEPTSGIVIKVGPSEDNHEGISESEEVVLILPECLATGTNFRKLLSSSNESFRFFTPTGLFNNDKKKFKQIFTGNFDILAFDKKETSDNDNSNNDTRSQGSDKETPQNRPFWRRPEFGALIIAASIYYLLSKYFLSPEINNSKMAPIIREISFEEFLSSTHLKEGMVAKLLVAADRTRVFVFLKPQEGGDALKEERGSQSIDRERTSLKGREFPAIVFTIGSVENFEKRLQESDLASSIPVVWEVNSFWSDSIGKNPQPNASMLTNLLVLVEVLISIVPVALIGWVMWKGYSLSQKGSGFGTGGSANPLSRVFNAGKSRAKLYNAETSQKVRFKDVAGMDETKLELAEFVKFLKEPQLYASLGARIPKGAILSGPPGTGKTLLAKALAGEAEVPFLSISGAEFVEMFVGVGASRVRDLFEEARRIAPCIVFIDEIDAIGRARGRSSPLGSGGNDERESTLNQLLVEMDGFSSDAQKEAPIVIIAGTNRPDILDPALLRPGRFDRHIALERPDAQGRLQIYLLHLKPLKLDPSGKVEEIASRLAYMTPGFVGADIANVCNEAALLAARLNAPAVTAEHLEAAVERVMAGSERRSRVLSPKERSIVAHHESGHALVGWHLEHADPVMKVTIIPRSSGALGFARILPSDAVLLSKAQLLARICVALGGRIAEEVIFGRADITSGARDDLDKVTQMAYTAVSVLGMDDRIGLLSFPNVDRSIGLQLPYSDETARLIDARVKVLVDECYKRAYEIITSHKSELESLATALLKRESLQREEIEAILGQRPFAPSHAYDLGRAA